MRRKRVDTTIYKIICFIHKICWYGLENGNESVMVTRHPKHVAEIFYLDGPQIFIYIFISHSH